MSAVERLSRSLKEVDDTARRLEEASIDLSSRIVAAADEEARRIAAEVSKLVEAIESELEERLRDVEERLREDAARRSEEASDEIEELAQKNWSSGVQAVLRELESILRG